MQILYFSWLRETIGTSLEDYQTDQKTVTGLINELVAREPRYAKVFEDLSIIKVAVDKELISDLETSILDAKEVAFFPPMTGG